MNAQELFQAVEQGQSFAYKKTVSIVMVKIDTYNKQEARRVSPDASKFLETERFPEKRTVKVIFSNFEEVEVDIEDISIRQGKADESFFTDTKFPIGKFIENGRTKLVFCVEKAKKLTSKVGYFYPVFNSYGIRVTYAIPQ